MGDLTTAVWVSYVVVVILTLWCLTSPNGSLSEAMNYYDNYDQPEGKANNVAYQGQS
jgi:hypothetical protein